MEKRRGRPYLGDDKKVMISMTLPRDVIAWLNSQKESRPKVVERLVRGIMTAEQDEELLSQP